MTGDVNTKLIAAFLSGNISAEEEKLFNQWLRESPANEELFHEMKKVWNNSSVILKVEDPQTDSEWQRLMDKIEGQAKTTQLTSFMSQHWLKVAASLVIILVSYWLLNRNDNSSSAETTILAGDEASYFYLPDSSKVRLAAHSTLTYEETFGQKTREVHLKGEGNFEVEHDSLHPFFVMTEYVVVRVVGTSFKVKEDSVVTVTVSEGKVKIYPRESPDNFLLVERGEQAYLKKEHHTTPVKVIEKPVPAVVEPEDNEGSPAADEITESETKVQTKTETESTEISAGQPEEKPVAEPAENTALEKEFSDPRSFLSLKSSWQKNQFKQSVVDGTLFNSAKLITYKNINLKITYTKENGKTYITYFTVYETILPGQTVDFHKNLVDMFTNTKDLKVEIDNVEVVYPSK